MVQAHQGPDLPWVAGRGRGPGTAPGRRSNETFTIKHTDYREIPRTRRPAAATGRVTGLAGPGAYRPFYHVPCATASRRERRARDTIARPSDVSGRGQSWTDLVGTCWTLRWRPLRAGGPSVDRAGGGGGARTAHADHAACTITMHTPTRFDSLTYTAHEQLVAPRHRQVCTDHHCSLLARERQRTRCSTLGLLLPACLAGTRSCT